MMPTDQTKAAHRARRVQAVRARELPDAEADCGAVGLADVQPDVQPDGGPGVNARHYILLSMECFI